MPLPIATRPSVVVAPAPDLAISSSNARDILQALIRRPPSENTYRERLECMRADSSITSWQALTRDPEQLKRLQENERSAWSNPAGFDKNLMPLAQALRQKNVWLPEVENFNANILKNLTTQMAGKYLEQFQSILQDPAPARAGDVSIVRGAPSAGKTTFLKGQFSLNTDAVKNMIQDRMPGTSMSQVHDQGVALVQQFSGTMEQRLAQPLTRDALYLWPKDFDKKMTDVGNMSGEPRLRFHDIQVDLTTLCCRILKRGTDEAVMGFDMLSQFYKAGLEHRGASIQSVKDSGSSLKEYSLSAWDGNRNVLVAQQAQGSKDFVIHDPRLFDKVTTWDKDSVQAEVDRVSGTTIDAPFINRFTASLPEAQAAPFREALSVYTGLTFKEALQQHAMRKPVATSLGARMLAQVVPG
jgi:hypothetical protein